MDFHFKDQRESELFAADLAELLKQGDVVALSGDLGVGKSTISRALLRHLAADPHLEVPSPTFTLVQVYDLPRLYVAHLDLYRVEEPEELEELGLEDTLEQGAALIEWPEMGDPSFWPHALYLEIREGDTPDTRVVSASSENEDWNARLQRLIARRDIVAKAGWEHAQRQYLQGDASTRSYVRLIQNGETAILMDSPARCDEPLLADGQAYSQAVHLAQNIEGFLAVGQALEVRGYTVPKTLAANKERGLALLGDLGSRFIVEDGEPVTERYKRAIDVLVDMHSNAWPQSVGVPGGGRYTLGNYDGQALLLEADLFLDWYLPYAKGQQASRAMREEFHRLWSCALAPLAALPQVWCLRDYHSPNLLWMDHETGLKQIGLIDFQDAVMGPSAYDVASLVMDARVGVSHKLQDSLIDYYCTQARENLLSFDEKLFRYGVAVLAAQRNTKILGGFVRLDQAYGKPEYIHKIPGILSYLKRGLDHPELKDLKDFMLAVLS
ncbi:tRNA (adenosine(37)-N6)-threonylcarbamoyltransferase complex ATPase subunit type 1 TsaE [Flexibacterium corallicola]|uniref:tRNA (adenosine(37)-N6)-threonylcarbamoyltransferase complex ATPase subunit type 1 TsaE n=1 Tax=Flexibacterium corallicola TaxID=3037259 RepID=UPI00286ECEBB|nr:tRNA (adenosine(37)-N6)-threonylcarbamoyltransferase complex ATPase subunit type 1 TsaE [Pseudovibrio sp. M1P-2-3]